MSTAYIDESKSQAICCWDAPDRESIESLFSAAGVTAQEIQEVVEYPGV
jgi:hypothetical protein